MHLWGQCPLKQKIYIGPTHKIPLTTLAALSFWLPGKQDQKYVPFSVGCTDNRWLFSTSGRNTDIKEAFFVLKYLAKTWRARCVNIESDLSQLYVKSRTYKSRTKFCMKQLRTCVALRSYCGKLATYANKWESLLLKTWLRKRSITKVLHKANLKSLPPFSLCNHVINDVFCFYCNRFSL